MKTITLTDEQFDNLFYYLNESDDFDPQTFDNLFDSILAAKETYLP